MCPSPAVPVYPPPLGPHRQIKHFVVLLMENRPIDHTFGCMAGEGVIGLDGIPPEGHKIKMDGMDPANTSEATVTCGTANYVCKNGPPMSMWNLHLQPGSNESIYPYDHDPAK